MKSFTIISAFFLCNLSWISVSGSESQTVEVQSGKNVTLLCSNISTTPTQTDWFRLAEGTKPSCISSMYKPDGSPTHCDGFQNGKFKMSSNISTVFLTIKQVDFSDSGLYFCGFYINTHTVISTATHLKVQGDADHDLEMDYDLEVEYNGQRESNGMANLISMILGGLTVLLSIIMIALAVKIRKLQSAVSENRQSGRNKNPDSDDLNYAALTFQAKAKRNRRPASDRELEPNVVYAATR